MKSCSLIALLAALLIALGGCGQTGALYLPGDAPEAAQTAGEPSAADNSDDDSNDDDDRPATPDTTP